MRGRIWIISFAIFTIVLCAAPALAQSSMKYNALSYRSSRTTFACLNGGCSTSPSTGAAVWTYCSDCTVNAGQYAAGGGGTCAININGLWECFTNGTAGPGTTMQYTGPVSVVGNQTNGKDQIAGMARIDLVRYADQFSGTDIGAKVNAAIASFPTNTCGKIVIPAGTYTFSTTIQLPVTQSAPCQLWGHGLDNTILKYTGTTIAINQTVDTAINSDGAELAYLTLDGSGAGPSAVGYQFANTQDGIVHDVQFANFEAGARAVAIRVDAPDTANTQTERWQFVTLWLYHNATAIQFKAENQSVARNISFEHGNMRNIWLTTDSAGTGQVGISIVSGTNATANLLRGDIQINGNLNNAGDVLFQTDRASLVSINIDENVEGVVGATRFKNGGPNLNSFILLCDSCINSSGNLADVGGPNINGWDKNTPIGEGSGGGNLLAQYMSVNSTNLSTSFPSLNIVAAPTTGGSRGISVLAGTNSSDYALLVNNRVNSAKYLKVSGDGGVGIGEGASDLGAGSVSLTGLVKVGHTTVGSLGACNATFDGAIYEVTDNNVTCSALAAPAAGGTTHCFVHCDGTAWKIF